MKIKSIDYWNSLQKDSDTDVMAESGDFVCLINGIAFLVQRKNDFNNVVCFRVNKSKTNLVKTFDRFRNTCAENGIQYIRVEGHNRRAYKMLFLVLRLAPKGVDVVYAPKQSEDGLNVYYVKTY